VLVTHSLSEIRNTCNRAICLNKGQVVFNGESQEAVRFYLEQVKKDEQKTATK